MFLASEFPFIHLDMSEKDFPEWINVFIASTYMKSSRPSIEATLPALENAEAIEDEKSDFPFSPASLESLHFDDVLDAASSKHRRDSRSKASKVHVTFVFRQEINVNFKFDDQETVLVAVYPQRIKRKAVFHPHSSKRNKK